MTAVTPTFTRRAKPATRFRLPPGAAATAPPESRGLARDEVRLLVATPEAIAHSQFRRLADHLDPGDLIVVNTSATIAAAVSGTRPADHHSPVVVHFSGPDPALPRHSGDRDGWIVELRDNELRRVGNARVGERIDLPHGVTMTLAGPWPDPSRRFGSRLWTARLTMESGVSEFLQQEGDPIVYDHIEGRWPISDYQTIFAEQPGSAEMVSAARPFSMRVLAELRTRGVALAPLVLHTGVSSLEADELPLPERFEVGVSTARLVNETRARGGRIVAAGTTVTRALETVADEDGIVHDGVGVTDLVIGPGHHPRVVNGLITGWHEPEASHLLMLEAVAGAELVGRAYEAALDTVNGGYLWHEFGDSCLLLP